MRPDLKFTAHVGLLCLFLSLTIFNSTVHAAPLRLKGIPTDKAVLGDAFIEAWTTLRKDLDTMSHGGVHPSLLRNWLIASPRFLVRDIALFANEPSVVLAAGQILANGARRKDLQILHTLERRHRKSRLSFNFKALLINAGDKKVLKSLLQKLNSSNNEAATDAAAVLAVAGDMRGITFLRSQISDCKEHAEFAAGILGHVGKKKDRLFLEKIADNHCNNQLLDVAIGEIVTKRNYSLYYDMISRRDPGNSRLVSPGGLYDTWFKALGHVIKEGAVTSAQVRAGIEKIRVDTRGKADKEVLRRRLKKLIILWSGVDGLLRSTSPDPKWPTDFKTARDHIRSRVPSGKNPPIFDRRVSACISICSATAKRLSYSDLIDKSTTLRSLTPDGGRAGDASFSTAWQATKGSKLILALDSTRSINAIWLANTCANEAGPRITEIKIDGKSPKHKWSISKKMSLITRYFQKVALNGHHAKRLTITAAQIKGGNFACLAEIRILYK